MRFVAQNDCKYRTKIGETTVVISLMHLAALAKFAKHQVKAQGFVAASGGGGRRRWSELVVRITLNHSSKGKAMANIVTRIVMAVRRLYASGPLPPEVYHDRCNHSGHIRMLQHPTHTEPPGHCSAGKVR